MSAKSTVVFVAADVTESNFTLYPEPFRPDQAKRFNRRLGDFAGIRNFGVNQTRIVPGGQSSHRHAHSRQDEFVYVIEGYPVLETDAGKRDLKPGDCVGFPCGTGDAHRFLNMSDSDVVLLVIGDRSAGDAVSYPDIDLKAELGDDGRYRMTRKDGTPY